jgi:hypothetical protein
MSTRDNAVADNAANFGVRQEKPLLLNFIKGPRLRAATQKTLVNATALRSAFK